MASTCFQRSIWECLSHCTLTTLTSARFLNPCWTGMENNTLLSNLDAVSMDGGQRRRILSEGWDVASLSCRCFLPCSIILEDECRCVPLLFSSWALETPPEPLLLPFGTWVSFSLFLPCCLCGPEILWVTNGVQPVRSNVWFLREMEGNAGRM